ncbi:hypothetical protein [Mariprofundus sp. KV]|uniref:hypothetical protein n=1 Tax=Mariprofundus sp. KV TaxID=2608715 RepID=UPI0015A30BBE|nr:hypothetical protein [Mariprofundus sp. KV]NWF36949.1 hypothetical protein [Mariprofundus sp. KV]
MIKRYTLMKLHMIFASVVFPITVMFFITGALYITDIKPDVASEEFRIELDQPFPADAKQLKEIAAKELARRNISEPLGRYKLKWDSDLQADYLFWDGENHWLKIRPSSSNAHVAVMKFYDPGIYSRFMSLHKGNGKESFNYFVVAMAITMMLTLFSGVIIGISLPKLRPMVLYSMGTGTLLFFGLMFYSQFVG